jgi:hypothetical protein
VYSLADTPQLPPFHPHLGSYTRALLVSQDRRHPFVSGTGSAILHTWNRAANIPLLYLVRQLMKNSAAQSLLRINGLLTAAPEGEFTDRFFALTWFSEIMGNAFMPLQTVYFRSNHDFMILFLRINLSSFRFRPSVCTSS